MISLNQLLDRVGDDLRAVTRSGAPSPTVTGVHISELDDPTPYLEGGELLLTTGIPVRGERRVRAYVERLHHRGIAGLGLGLGVGTDVVPDELRDACDEYGLALFTVPPGTPFMAVSRGYWDLVGRREQAHLTATLRMQTSLAQAATRPEAVESVLRVLSEAVGGWAAWLPINGHPDAVWPSTERGVLPSLRAETRRLNLTGSRSSATFPLHGMDVVVYSVVSDTGSGNRTAGFLAVAAGRVLGRPDRQLMLTGCMLLANIAQQGWQLSRANATVGRIAATLILNSMVDAARLAVEERDDTELPARVRVIALSGVGLASWGSEQLATLVAELIGASEIDRIYALVAGSALRCECDGMTFVIVPHRARSGSSDESDLPRTRQRGEGDTSDTKLRGAIGPTVLLGDVAAGIPQLALDAAAARPGNLLDRSGLDDTRTTARVVALRDYPRADLVGTVRSYLRNRGQWESSARELGIHRNSLRHRIQIAERLMGANLDDPDVAATLWLALRRMP